MSRMICGLLACAGLLTVGDPGRLLAAASALTADGTAPRARLTIECKNLNVGVQRFVDDGEVRQAEEAIHDALSHGEGSLEPACSAVLWSNLAAVMSITGRLAEAEKYAQAALKEFSGLSNLAEGVLVRPLQVLAAAQIGENKLRDARQTLETLRKIRSDQPEKLAIVHGLDAALLDAEGQLDSAETEYHLAITAWEQDGRGNSTVVAAVLNGLASLYIKEKHLDEALRVADREISIVNSARDATPMDQIAALNLRATAHARSSHWHAAREDLQRAVSLAEGEPYISPNFLFDLLTSYAFTLRKDHCPAEAHVVRARASRLHAPHAIAPVVDLSQLFQNK